MIGTAHTRLVVPVVLEDLEIRRHDATSVPYTMPVRAVGVRGRSPDGRGRIPPASHDQLVGPIVNPIGLLE